MALSSSPLLAGLFFQSSAFPVACFANISHAFRIRFSLESVSGRKPALQIRAMKLGPYASPGVRPCVKIKVSDHSPDRLKIRLAQSPFAVSAWREHIFAENQSNCKRGFGNDQLKSIRLGCLQSSRFESRRSPKKYFTRSARNWCSSCGSYTCRSFCCNKSSQGYFWVSCSILST